MTESQQVFAYDIKKGDVLDTWGTVHEIIFKEPFVEVRAVNEHNRISTITYDWNQLIDVIRPPE